MVGTGDLTLGHLYRIGFSFERIPSLFDGDFSSKDVEAYFIFKRAPGDHEKTGLVRSLLIYDALKW